MNWHSIPQERLLRELEVEPSQGLAPQEAQRRLQRYGPNVLEVRKGPSALQIFLRQFKDVLIIILMAATVLSALVGELADAGLIMAIVLFSAGLGFYQEYRAERAIEALRKMLAPTITVLRGGQEVELDSQLVVPGDVLVVEAGDRVPADARVIESHSLMANEASLTGESVPVEKAPGLLPQEAPLPERKNMLFTGTVLTYGRGRAVVVATAMKTELGKIAQEVVALRAEKTPLERRTAEIGKWLGIGALLVCALVAGLGIFRQALGEGLDLQFALSMVMFAVALAVAAVPEALAGIVTGTLAIGMHEMAKNNALVRRMPAVETLGSVTVICSDKTGTITRGEMTVRRLYLSGGRWVEVSGVGYEPKGQFSLPPRDFRMALLAGLLCSDATLQQGQGRWLIKGDPTEGALVVLAAKAGLHPKELRLQHPRVEEVPFSSERKRMTTVHELQGRLVAFMKGAPEVVLSLCSHQEGGRALSSQDREQILKAAEQMASQGLRVLALAMRPLQLGPSQPQELEQQMHFLALVGMMDPPRQEAVESVRLCRTVGIRPVMITGDHKLTAMAVAREVGIYEEGELAISGQELQAMNEQEFARQVERISVYARVSPMDKLRIVRALKAKGHVVAMTGDGVNDAPALKHADIGVAMGITGTEVTKEAADMVLADDNFATIVKAIRQGRWIYDNIKKYLTFLLEANVAEILVLGGIAVLKGHEYLPLLPAAILYINLVTDGLPAIALGIAPPEPDIMERPPRDPRESVFSLEVRTFIFLFAAIYTPLFFWVFFSAQSILEARTEIFFLFVALELVIAMNLVSLRQSILRVRPFKWLIAAVLANVVLTAVLVQIPAVREAFGVGIPSLRDIEIVLALSAGVVLAMEAAKWWLRRRLQSPKAPKSLRST